MHAFFFLNLKMNDGLLLSQESSTKPVTPEGIGKDIYKGENGFWAPLDLLKCTSSANTDVIPDGWGPNFAAVLGGGSSRLFQGNSRSLSLSPQLCFQAPFFLPYLVSVPILSRILLT